MSTTHHRRTTAPVPPPDGRPAGTKVEHPSVPERAARGRAVRRDVPRTSHAAWEPSADRADPVEILEEQARTRLAELTPIRYGRMLASPFAFYRGAAAVMAADLAGERRTGLDAQLCGDAHLSNFGGFAAPDRRLIFGLNDFDETLPGPFEWDVKRLAASFAVAGRARGYPTKVRDMINERVGRSYRESMHTFAGMRNLDLWYARFDVERDVRARWGDATREQKQRFKANVARARSKDSVKALAKLTHIVDGVAQIRSDPPLIVPLRDHDGVAERGGPEALRALIRSYRDTLPRDRRHLLERFEFRDAARKVVGVGSVGTRAWIVLMLGRDNADPLFLQVKEAQASVLERHLGASEFGHHGERVVEGQRLMQAASDILLGWLTVVGFDGVERDYYVRQLWDEKGSALVEVMEPNAMELYAGVCAWALAKAHARSGDAVAIAAYLGSSSTFDRSLATFAEAYADQNDRDYDALRRAVEAGRIAAQTGI
jgi:uncharacterized protein (DUF2252 family)